MNKILYALPALAMLGLLPAADAASDQRLAERIDRLQEKIADIRDSKAVLYDRIDKLEAKIDALDPATDQKRIDKLEAKIDRMQERLEKRSDMIVSLKARIAELESQKTDRTGPNFVSATLNMDTGILTVVFDETMDISKTSTSDMFLGLVFLGDKSAFDDAAPDSNILTMTLNERALDIVEHYESMQLHLLPGSVRDLAGNGLANPSAPSYVDKVYG